ncbi:uncharacterized protein EDB93DRAFT_941111 [Suillus bovinus]|uniref:uncharacterized protein n=1 Tax=Suillus bovinus TaxID=48563 RepID=UPI001B885584|nr:uncharacterized protein EDB93DRAFT_941111 [Suillus bovinus]KAG2131288.1 hypothetical protein EDB93DRAFT_941111 [Suillus bovinus]
MSIQSRICPRHHNCWHASYCLHLYITRIFFPNYSDDGAQRSQPAMRQKIWKSDPTHQVISLKTSKHVIVIYTKIFFEPSFLKGASTSIPWEGWGPLNVRIFQRLGKDFNSAAGSRVLMVNHAIDTTANTFVGYSLLMMDFSPLAIKHRQGLGRLVRESSTIDLDGELVTTSLPYVEVVSRETPIYYSELVISSIDDGRIYAFHFDEHGVKVIKVWDGV